MKYTIVTTFIFALMGPFTGMPQPEASEAGLRAADLETRITFRGKRGSGFKRRGGSGFYGKGRHYRHGKHRFFRYGYPYYYDRYYGGFRKYLPWQDRSWYPHQGGSDYREWFDLPRTFPRR